MQCPVHEATIKAKETHCAFIAAYLVPHGIEPLGPYPALTEAEAFELFGTCTKIKP